jgi:hypothetical protein
MYDLEKWFDFTRMAEYSYKHLTSDRERLFFTNERLFKWFVYLLTAPIYAIYMIVIGLFRTDSSKLMFPEWKNNLYFLIKVYIMFPFVLLFHIFNYIKTKKDVNSLVNNKYRNAEKTTVIKDRK